MHSTKTGEQQHPRGASSTSSMQSSATDARRRHCSFLLRRCGGGTSALFFLCLSSFLLAGLSFHHRSTSLGLISDTRKNESDSSGTNSAVVPFVLSNLSFPELKGKHSQEHSSKYQLPTGPDWNAPFIIDHCEALPRYRGHWIDGQFKKVKKKRLKREREGRTPDQRQNTFEESIVQLQPGQVDPLRFYPEGSVNRSSSSSASRQATESASSPPSPRLVAENEADEENEEQPPGSVGSQFWWTKLTLQKHHSFSVLMIGYSHSRYMFVAACRFLFGITSMNFRHKMEHGVCRHPTNTDQEIVYRAARFFNVSDVEAIIRFSEEVAAVDKNNAKANDRSLLYFHDRSEATPPLTRLPTHVIVSRGAYDFYFNRTDLADLMTLFHEAMVLLEKKLRDAFLVVKLKKKEGNTAPPSPPRILFYMPHYHHNLKCNVWVHFCHQLSAVATRRALYCSLRWTRAAIAAASSSETPSTFQKAEEQEKSSEFSSAPFSLQIEVFDPYYVTHRITRARVYNRTFPADGHHYNFLIQRQVLALLFDQAFRLRSRDSEVMVDVPPPLLLAQSPSPSLTSSDGLASSSTTSGHFNLRKRVDEVVEATAEDAWLKYQKDHLQFPKKKNPKGTTTKQTTDFVVDANSSNSGAAAESVGTESLIPPPPSSSLSEEDMTNADGGQHQQQQQGEEEQQQQTDNNTTGKLGESMLNNKTRWKETYRKQIEEALMTYAPALPEELLPNVSYVDRVRMKNERRKIAPLETILAAFAQPVPVSFHYRVNAPGHAPKPQPKLKIRRPITRKEMPPRR